MKKLMNVFALVATPALMALSHSAGAQTVAVNGLGSSALFLQAGLGANNPSGAINATCVWSGNNSTAAGNVVTATDTSAGTSLTDSGNAWVAWTGSCTSPAAGTKIYAYLQTDSVVGNRCLFNANKTSGPECSISYPTSSPAPAGLILGVANEVALPSAIATALNSSIVNAAGTDIRPEDAWFATARARAACGVPVATGSQYLGLGYSNGSNINSTFSSSVFHVIDFTLPTAYSVTPVGATPILVVVNGASTSSGFGTGLFTDISSQNLAKFLNGTSTLTDQVTNASASTGNAVTTLLREPLSGTYNTMEYNVPNRTASGFQTSQEAGNCPIVNPLLLTAARRRAIGTGEELTQVRNTTTNGDTLGYGFWSVANFAGFTSSASPNARYLKVDGVDPLTNGSYNGVIPLSGSTNMSNVTLTSLNDVNTNYPIWSLLRFVSAASSPSSDLSALATATQGFVSFGNTTSRPDFIIFPQLNVLRSHFVPPAPSTQPNPAVDGDPKGLGNCNSPEVGGDVGGVVLSTSADDTYCQNTDPNGQTGMRR